MKLTEEENKAIEYLKRHIIPYYGYKGRIEFMLNDILLNLIEKLQKENEELRKLTEFQKEYRNKLEQDLFENCSNFVVPKDKIREKIEFYKRYGKIKNSDEYVMSVEIEVLEELLEE